MGYANPGQVANGIHMRQYARTYILSDPSNNTRIVFVNMDACMPSQGLKQEVYSQTHGLKQEV